MIADQSSKAQCGGNGRAIRVPAVIFSFTTTVINFDIRTINSVGTFTSLLKNFWKIKKRK